MRLRVVAEQGVVARHRRRLRGEVFEVAEPAGRQLLAQYGEGLAVCGGDSSRLSDDPAGEAEPVSVATLGLSSRVLDALQANGIETVAALREALARGEEAMVALPGIGPRAVVEIREALDTNLTA